MTDSARKMELPQGRDAYQRLVDEIRSGALHPGDRLLEAELALRFGISRTPVREAVRRLEADGLVVHVPRVGATVRQLDYTEITELYEMRTVLEATAARFAARAATEIELQELEEINAEMASAGGALYDLNRQFHRVLLDSARNRYLAHSMNAMHKTLLILGPSTMEEAGRAQQAVAEHRAIVEALRARDEHGAEELMRVHMQNAQRVRLRQLRSRADGFEEHPL